MPRFKCILIAAAVLLCMAVPGFTETNTLDPDAGTWTVQLNSPGANVSISGLGQPYSTVQMTIVFTDRSGKSSQTRNPINVMYLTKVPISPEKKDCTIERISFECTKGEVSIAVQPTSGSGGASGDYW